MGSTNTQLPSPNSRRSQDPNNRGITGDFLVSIAPVAGDAELTLPLFGALKGVPACTLSGGAHVGQIPCLSASATGLATITLHFAEAVAGGDLITWPDKDEAIRARNGGYVAGGTYDTGGTPGTNPAIVSVEIDTDNLQAAITFDQDITVGGPDPAGSVQFATQDQVTLEIQGTVIVIGAVWTVALRWSPNIQAADTSTSTGIGAHVVGVLGGLPATDWTDFVGSTLVPVNGPQIVHSEKTPLGPAWTVGLFFSAAITANIDTNQVIVDDGTFTYDNTAACANFDGTTLVVQCDNVVGGTSSPNMVQATTPVGTGDATALDNQPFLAYPCPG